MKKFLVLYFFASSCFLGFAQQNDKIVDEKEVTRILNTLASDEMEGRASFTRGIEKAANFIEDEFRKIGLEPYAEENFRQSFSIERIVPNTWEVVLDGKTLNKEEVIISSNHVGFNWNDDPEVEIIRIEAGADFASQFRSITNGKSDALVIVDPSFESLFDRYKSLMMRGKVGQSSNQSPSVVFVKGLKAPKSFRVSFTNLIEQLPLFNMVGMLPGKSRPDEYVIFSGHYDHIGIISPVGQDSIANGADDDASGVSAVISLANYYKRKNNNERTLLFVAFTAEEIGLIGSKYFSQQLDPDKITAMINIEMIGKDSRFGDNTVYVTGFDQSNLAKIMQKNVSETAFEFHPDPYPTQNLFYRSDNASLAAAGVPAHSFSTVQIEKDEFYHTVKDEVSTLNIKNIISTIKAIAIGAESIVAGIDTPDRVKKLNQ